MLLTAASTACSGDGGLAVESAWARPAAEGDNSAVYFEIRNNGESDRLLRAESDVAQQVMLHRTVIDADGNASMGMQAEVEVPAGGTVAFEPGGLHVMLIGLRRTLEAGERLMLTLQFERSGEVPLQVPVESQ
jgi:hypothetical protein